MAEKMQHETRSDTRSGSDLAKKVIDLDEVGIPNLS